MNKEQLKEHLESYEYFVAGYFHALRKLDKLREPELITFIPEEVPVFKPLEQFISGVGVSQVELIKTKLKQTSSTIQKTKQELKQIPQTAVVEIQAVKSRLASLQQQATLQRQAQRQAQQQLLKQAQQLKQSQLQAQAQIITPIISPKIPFPFISKPTPSLISL